MSLHEDPEFTIQDAADLLPTGNAEAPAAEADPTAFDTEDAGGAVAVEAPATEADPTAFDTEDAGDAVAVEAPAEEPPAAEAPAVLDEDELLEEEAERARPRPESPYDRPGRWYVVHTQSGYEKKVRQNLEARIESMHLEEQVHEVVIPMEDVVEFRNGRKVTVSKKMFPGYLLVRCRLDDISWTAIRDTPGIVNFVGSGGKPSPLSRREIETFLQVPDEDAPEAPRRSRARFGYEVGETIRVKEGPFADFSGEIIEINEDQLKVKVLVNIFGRETPVELEFSQVAQL